ncbi:energy-coupling factor ABC transporter ATP-binding protein [Desulfonatronum thiodismutans]|uniref:energy-coupling factor ABC transporter ATP-binding protein n=1 Tax=Desulfonatronum thiodismutans TaxID=159290 RepID=UPI0004ABE89C|nr:ABC transporter ATP-binding protein [Desulfonatronum thiodismutans]
MPQTTPPAIALNDLCFSYPDKPHVLDHLNLRIAPGERVGLIGPNGAGKTTLFLLISGILKPTSGEIQVHGKKVVSGGFNPEVTLVFQKSDDQLFCPSVWEDVAFGPRNMGLSEEQVTERVHTALVTVGAQDLAQRPVHHLSEGEKRIVAIAGALAMHPRVIIYDEPSAGLDIRARRRLIGLLKQSDQTLLIASHDLELTLEVCTRVVLLDQGRIVAHGPAKTIMADEDLMTAHGQEKPHSLIPHALPHDH